MAKAVLQIDHQPQIAVGGVVHREIVEFDGKIQVASIGIEIRTDSGAEEIQPAYVVATAKIQKAGAFLFDQIDHGWQYTMGPRKRSV